MEVLGETVRARPRSNRKMSCSLRAPQTLVLRSVTREHLSSGIQDRRASDWRKAEDSTFTSAQPGTPRCCQNQRSQRPPLRSQRPLYLLTQASPSSRPWTRSPRRVGAHKASGQFNQVPSLPFYEPLDRYNQETSVAWKGPPTRRGPDMRPVQREGSQHYCFTPSLTVAFQSPE